LRPCKQVGTGLGVGFNINIPWPRHGVCDNDYLSAFHRVVIPVANAFAPDLIMVSAGFDAALGDPLGGCHITPSGYAEMTRMLTAVPGARVVFVLEGGYNLMSVSQSLEAVLRVLLDESPPNVCAGNARFAVDVCCHFSEVMEGGAELFWHRFRHVERCAGHQDCS
jgi:histone deacetylase 6